jgi:CxxC motif-containing protein (DUF1111 family)
MPHMLWTSCAALAEEDIDWQAKVQRQQLNPWTDLGLSEVLHDTTCAEVWGRGSGRALRVGPKWGIAAGKFNLGGWLNAML